MKKFELTDDIIQKPGGTRREMLYRIRALIDIPNKGVKAGDLGGYVERESNLCHDDSSWIGGDAHVCENAKVYGNALVTDRARITKNAKIYGDSIVRDDAEITGLCEVYDRAKVYGRAIMQGATKVYGSALIYGNAALSGETQVLGNTRVFGAAHTQHDCYINNNDSILWIDNLGPNWETMTFYKCSDNTIKMSYSWYSGTINDFLEWIKSHKEYIKYNSDGAYNTAIELAMKKIKM